MLNNIYNTSALKNIQLFFMPDFDISGGMLSSRAGFMRQFVILFYSHGITPKEGHPG